MDPYELPPPKANITFPPDNRDQLNINYLDSFVTSWVTPQFAQTPCHVSLYFWINATLDWQCVWNQSALLNETRIIPLSYLTAPGLGQLNLDYHDPDGSRITVTGGIFSALHDPDPIAPKAITWNQDALTKTSTTAPAAQSTSATAAPTSLATRFLATATPSPASAVQAPTSSPSVTNKSTASPSVIGNIVLGSALGLLTMALLTMAWFRWQKKRQKAKPTTLGRGKQSAVKPRIRYLGSLFEKDARTTPTELSSADEGLELSAESDSRVELSTTRWGDVSATPTPITR